MTGHGAKLGRKMHQAVAALYNSRTVEEAAKSIGVSSKTLRRWQALPEFDRAYREFGNAMFRHSLARLQQTAGAAVAVLRNILGDPNAPAAVKARSAYYVLDQTRKSIEIDQIEARLTELERVKEGENGVKR
jgi:hypothetical protein